MNRISTALFSLFVVAMIFMLNIDVAVYADDNATSGDGTSELATEGKGYYRLSEFMYKVTVWVGLYDTANESFSLDNYQMIGTKPIYMRRSNFTLNPNISFTDYCKKDYLEGTHLIPSGTPTVLIDDSLPAIPITHDGNMASVKSYFGDTNTLNMLINKFAQQVGTTREGLVSNIQITIDGIKKKYPPNEILPNKVDGVFQNKVSWVIIYEPVVISYLQDRTTILAFTATEYALAQKLGYFNFQIQPGGEYISGLTHSDLPNSVVLEESWFGYPVVPALPDDVYWSMDRIIQGGGWGMRMLGANGIASDDGDTIADFEYRPDTDVVTSVWVKSTSNNITPDDYAYITLNANGQTVIKAVTIPSGGTELVWLKWHTPVADGTVNVATSISGNSTAQFNDNSNYLYMTASIKNISGNEPPNPTANDIKPLGFTLPNLPAYTQVSSNSWYQWRCFWVPDWQWVSNWNWISDWDWVADLVYDAITGTWSDNGYWENNGYWEDNGNWEDLGDWEYEKDNYEASLNSSMDISPDSKVPTASSSTIKSGYGINIKVISNVGSNAPSTDITGLQTVQSFYPEFSYKNYWRLLDKIQSGYSASFELKNNRYSTYNSRVHFTALWYPDGNYQVYAKAYDVWTPGGMLTNNLSDSITISGNLFQDWHIGPIGNR